MSSASVPGPLGGPAPELPPEPGTQVDRAVEWIRHAAVSGRLSPGDRIIESDLAAHLHMSRTPIREAIRRLAGEGLLELLPNRGAAVSTWSEDDLEEIFEVRAEMEGFIAELAAHRITDVSLAQMSNMHERMLELAGRSTRALGSDEDRSGGADGNGDSDVEALWDEYAKASNAFHRTLADAARNARLAAVVVGLQAVPLFHRSFRRSSPETLTQSNHEHAEILRALRAGAPEWARAAATCHIHSTRELLVAPRRSDAVDT